VAGILTDEGYAVRTASDTERSPPSGRKPSLLILDIWMPAAAWTAWPCRHGPTWTPTAGDA
jgi:hypothetical protein